MYIFRRRKPPSQTSRAFLKNHAKDLIVVDFFTVPTATFRILFVLVVLRQARRRLVHFNVTEHPTAAWTARQLVEACALEETPGHLIRDRDQVYCHSRSSSCGQWCGWRTTVVEYRRDDAHSKARASSYESGRKESRGPADESVLGAAERCGGQAEKEGSLSSLHRDYQRETGRSLQGPALCLVGS